MNKVEKTRKPHRDPRSHAKSFILLQPIELQMTGDDDEDKHPPPDDD